MRTSARTGDAPAKTPNAPYKGGTHALLAVHRRTRTLRQPDIPATVPVVAVATADGGTARRGDSAGTPLTMPQRAG